MAKGRKISRMDEERQIYYGKMKEMEEKGGKRGKNKAATVPTIVAVFAKLPGSPVHI